MRTMYVVVLTILLVSMSNAEALTIAPVWTQEGDQPGAAMGESVATAGDVNGDGFSDVIIGAPGYDRGENDEGMAFLFYGSPVGLAGSPDWSVESNQTNASLGHAVSSAGDVNGDRLDDIIISAPGYAFGREIGGAFVWHGVGGGLHGSGIPSSADWHAEGVSAAIAETAGDVNGDTFDDIIVSAGGGGRSGNAKMLVWHGGREGLGAIGIPGNADWSASGEKNSLFGVDAGSAGDVNGDGFGDIIIGAPGHDGLGAAFVWYGSAAGLGHSGRPRNADWRVNGTGLIWTVGRHVSSAGDVNGDHYDEVLVGAFRASAGQDEEGAAYAFYGGPAGLGPDAVPADADWHAESDVVRNYFGYGVAAAGDVNGDGFGDILIHGGQESKIYLWYGSITGLGPDGRPGNADWASSDTPGCFTFEWGLGCSMSTAGDVNSDGFDDVLIGIRTSSNPESGEGRVHLYLGEP